MTTKNQTTTWRGFRKQARAHAARLEKEAAGARLLAMAEDPLDALAMLWDMAAYERHMVDARAARLHGTAEPQPPVPISRLMTGFNQQLEDKVTAIAALLEADEIERIRRVMPGFAAAMESNDVDVMVMIRDLLQRPPEVIAGWLRAHLDAVERRFAS